MGKKGEATKDALIETTQGLIEARGYFGTGLNQVIADSGAPRGSLYFHFPGGKDQLVGETVARASAGIDALIGSIEATDAKQLMAVLLSAVGQRLEASNWNQGCPVATVALETAATNDAIQQVCSTAYAGWHRTLRAKLVADGRADADDLATFLLSLLEGAMLLARAHRSTEPFAAVTRVIDSLL
ncbi:TetR/AcrR family transcriptional regulator [Nocardia sp. BMG111209]|uniref:TetR/AcrR family transcriptional regulator n=1 Tax=Nocardia sp. BMG111209 TaxID=1160137 RepID=UPI0003648CEC|nr:TetR/AcrR family transcriptional regulator [Nocardia sp. BMG111209]